MSSPLGKPPTAAAARASAAASQNRMSTILPNVSPPASSTLSGANKRASIMPATSLSFLSSSWRASDSESLQYFTIFRSLDTADKGEISSEQAASILSRTGLPQSQLSDIWQAAKKDTPEKFNLRFISVALKLAAVAQQYGGLISISRLSEPTGPVRLDDQHEAPAVHAAVSTASTSPAASLHNVPLHLGGGSASGDSIPGPASPSRISSFAGSISSASGAPAASASTLLSAAARLSTVASTVGSPSLTSRGSVSSLASSGAVSSSSTGGISASDRERFGRMFDGARPDPATGLLSADVASNLFRKSKLPTETLGLIWNLADTQRRGKLDRNDFAIAMYLIQVAMTKGASAIPSTLPSSLLSPPPAATSTPTPAAIIPQPRASFLSSPILTPTSVKPTPAVKSLSSDSVPQTEIDEFKRDFATLDSTSSGFIGGHDAVAFFTKSGLSKEELFAVWNLADRKGLGRLGCTEFIAAMHLIRKLQAGQKIPSSLNAEVFDSIDRGLKSESSILSRSFTATSSVSTPPATTTASLLAADVDAHPDIMSLSAQIASQATLTSAKAAERDGYERNLGSLTAKKTELTSKLEAAKASYAAVVTSVEVLQREYNTAHSQLTDLHSQVATAEGELQQAQAQRDALVTEMHELSRQVVDISSRAAQFRQNTITITTIEMAQLTQQLEAEKAALDEATKAALQASDEHRAALATVEDLHRQLEQVQLSRQQAEAQAAATRQAIQDVAVQSTALQQQIDTEPLPSSSGDDAFEAAFFSEPDESVAPSVGLDMPLTQSPPQASVLEQSSPPPPPPPARSVASETLAKRNATVRRSMLPPPPPPPSALPNEADSPSASSANSSDPFASLMLARSGSTIKPTSSRHTPPPPPPSSDTIAKKPSSSLSQVIGPDAFPPLDTSWATFEPPVSIEPAVDTEPASVPAAETKYGNDDDNDEESSGDEFDEPVDPTNPAAYKVTPPASVPQPADIVEEFESKFPELPDLDVDQVQPIQEQAASDVLPVEDITQQAEPDVEIKVDADTEATRSSSAQTTDSTESKTDFGTPLGEVDATAEAPISDESAQESPAPAIENLPISEPSISPDAPSTDAPVADEVTTTAAAATATTTAAASSASTQPSSSDAFEDLFGSGEWVSVSPTVTSTAPVVEDTPAPAPAPAPAPESTQPATEVPRDVIATEAPAVAAAAAAAAAIIEPAPTPAADEFDALFGSADLVSAASMSVSSAPVPIDAFDTNESLPTYEMSFKDAVFEDPLNDEFEQPPVQMPMPMPEPFVSAAPSQPDPISDIPVIGRSQSRHDADSDDIEQVKVLVGMGFSREKAIGALEQSGFDVQEAAERLMMQS
ncbi:hypothetical protein GQ42DRAFT_162856 [Ramicandelaber brevisporus]|nr:hypothetical protein GQ42DRAFT_162856 [Ramicandelaber brevisporus]